MSNKIRRFVPRLEVFDERCQPATWSLSGTILTVTGDPNLAEHITITDNGQSTGLVLDDGTTSTTFSTPINAIVVNTGAGDDQVTYNLAPGTLTGNRSIVAHTGAGADTFTTNMAGVTLDTGVNLDISAYGDGGKDTFILNAQNVNTNINAILNVYYAGQAGKDVISMDYTNGGLDFGTVILQKDQKH